MSNAADTKALKTLHGKLADKFAEIIDEIDVETKGGAAMLNVMRQFLKDNGIDAVPADGSPMGTLAGKVAEFPFDPAAEGMTH